MSTSRGAHLALKVNEHDSFFRCVGLHFITAYQAQGLFLLGCYPLQAVQPTRFIYSCYCWAAIHYGPPGSSTFTNIGLQLITGQKVSCLILIPLLLLFCFCFCFKKICKCEWCSSLLLDFLLLLSALE